jgi:small subunit ribosomal protein S20
LETRNRNLSVVSRISDIDKPGQKPDSAPLSFGLKVMANTAQARKRARQNVARRARNASQRSALRSAVKTTRQLAAKGDASGAKSSLPMSSSAIDKAAGKGLISRNRAARLKSRLARSARPAA